MDHISDYDILLIRQCKKNNPSLRSMRRIIGWRCGSTFDYVDKSHVVYHLTNLIIKYGLVRDWNEFLLNDLNPVKWWTKEEKSYIDNLLDVLISKIACSEISKFPRYRSPLRFRK
jgi:hypothetical protein